MKRIVSILAIFVFAVMLAFSTSALTLADKDSILTNMRIFQQVRSSIIIFATVATLHSPKHIIL